MEKAGMRRNNMQIIKAEKQHINDVLKIEKTCFSMAWSKDSFMGELKTDDSHFTISIDDNGDITGFCILRLFGEEAEIFNIAVLPKNRRNHIAEELLEEALSFAKTNGAFSVYLEVRASNEPAKKLYEKVGFNKIGIRRGYYDMPPEDAILMMWETEEWKK